jgi:formamidopyrimidine-DNA glycosylase
MDRDEIILLYNSIKDILNLSREKGTFAYESDFYGQKGGYTMDYFLVGYKENQPCPVCGETIVSIKTGSTTTFICPACQKL